MRKRFLILLLLPMPVFLHYILHNPHFFSHITTSFLQILILINHSIISLYQENPEYLWVSALLAIEVYLFVSIILKVSLYGISMSKYKSREIKSEKNIHVPRHSSRHIRLLYLLITMVRYSIIMIGDLRRIFSIISGDYKRCKELDISKEFVISALILGVLISISLVLIYEISQVLFWFLFIFYLILTASYIIALGEVNELDNRMRKELGIWHEDDVFIISYGITRPFRLKVEEKLIALGLSVSTGICGVTTTLGAAILNASSPFTLVPLTFDMLSLISALIEFSGLKAMLLVFKNLKEMEIGMLSMLLVIFLELLPDRSYKIPFYYTLNLVFRQALHLA